MEKLKLQKAVENEVKRQSAFDWDALTRKKVQEYSKKIDWSALTRKKNGEPLDEKSFYMNRDLLSSDI